MQGYSAHKNKGGSQVRSHKRPGIEKTIAEVRLPMSHSCRNDKYGLHLAASSVPILDTITLLSLIAANYALQKKIVLSAVRISHFSESIKHDSRAFGFGGLYERSFCKMIDIINVNKHDRK